MHNTPCTQHAYNGTGGVEIKQKLAPAMVGPTGQVPPAMELLYMHAHIHVCELCICMCTLRFLSPFPPSLQVHVSGPLHTRRSHSSTVIYISPTLTEVVMFGGSSAYMGDKKMAHTTILQFSEWWGVAECVLIWGRDEEWDGREQIMWWTTVLALSYISKQLLTLDW